jgi:glycogen(starch) synthase
MKVLMFGWEFPPMKSGGLGTACKDLTKGLSKNDVDVVFVMPQAPKDAEDEYVKLIGANNLTSHFKIRNIDTILTPYQSYDSYNDSWKSIQHKGTKGQGDIYGNDIFNEVERYAEAAKIISLQEDHDLIHVHDWMTYKAGINAKKISGKPLIVHIHATEFDRTGGNPNNVISHKEYEGLKAADKIIANSNFTKNNVMKHYGVPSEKIDVVHWGIDEDNPHYNLDYAKESPFKKKEKVVLFLGRVTLQKGPDYFVEAARKVKDHISDVKFVVAGTGDMLPRMMEKAAELDLSKDMLFTGFLNGPDVHKAFQMADLYVMSSVSEPFGLVALESLKNNTPVLLSKQSGVSEVVTNALKCDFWDTNAMANKIINTLKYPALHQDLMENSFNEAKGFNLDIPAKKTIEIYNKVLA